MIIDPNCNRRDCAVPNCGKDFVAATLPGECCERCVPWEYANSLGIRYPAPAPPPQPSQDHQRGYDPYNQQARADVYIYGPDGGSRVSAGQSVYFDCEVNAPYNQNAQPRWTRGGGQVNIYICILIYSHLKHIILCFSNCHTKCKARLLQATAKSHVSQSQTLPKVMVADMNVVLVQETQVIKLQSIYK